VFIGKIIITFTRNTLNHAGQLGIYASEIRTKTEKRRYILAAARLTLFSWLLFAEQQCDNPDDPEIDVLFYARFCGYCYI
jgi:hypothetical protein